MQLKMGEKRNKFDSNKIRKLLEEQNEYIMDLLTTFDVPDSVEDENLEEMYLLDSKDNPKTKHQKNTAGTSRAQDAEELQERMEIIRNKMKSKKTKASERALKKREMKVLKKDKTLKRQLISGRKSMKNEKVKEEKVSPEEKKLLNKHIKPIFNEAGKMVFSKFDFASHPGAKPKKSKNDRVMKNPQQLLKVMKEQKHKISELIQTGDDSKAQEIKENLAWKKAFDKTEGKKVKDDPNLLYKAVKRRKDEKKKSKQKWTERKDRVEQEIQKRQKKREENINKRLKDKKVKKLKRLTKKGRVIPGF